ncbi:MAG: DNA polymerase III subunit delta' [Dehalococcoidia bacterium]|nr:DNA polymerase III subunit delta' [Dehalococcoidia bacterium]
MWRTVGHPRAMAYLERSLGSGRMAHAYLLVGPRHVGKGTLAQDVARALNCPEDSPPCGTCSACQRIDRGTHPDVLRVGLLSDEKTGRPRTEISIDQMREVASLAALPPYEGRHRVFIIDGAELLSTEAANALLKTLEEPPPKVVFLLLSAAEGALLPTVTSRCQRVELRPLPYPEVARFLEAAGMGPEEARLRARLSSGRPGRALDEEFFRRRGDALAQAEALLSQGSGDRLALATERAASYERGRDAEFLDLWLGWWRDLLLLRVGCPDAVANADHTAALERAAGALSLSQIRAALHSLRAAMEGLRRHASPRLALEVMVLSLPHMEA